MQSPGMTLMEAVWHSLPSQLKHPGGKPSRQTEQTTRKPQEVPETHALQAPPTDRIEPRWLLRGDGPSTITACTSPRHSSYRAFVSLLVRGGPFLGMASSESFGLLH